MAQQTHQPQTIVVGSCGGGVARHYRVQYHAANEKVWRMYGTYRANDQAQECVARLNQRGYEARIVRYGISPVAA